jgi:hypothetical protein
MNMRLLTILFITSLLAVSCTIQKRTFRNGYYISWNKSALKEKAKHAGSVLEEESETNAEPIALRDSVFTEIPDVAERNEVVVPSETGCETPVNPSEDLVKGHDSIRKETSETGYTEALIPEQSDEAIISVRKKKEWSEPLETNEKGPNLFAINSLVFAIGYVILSFITIFTNLFALAVICFVAALTFAIIAIIKWKRNKDSFWGTFFAVMALGLLALGTLVLLVFILAGSI